MLEDILNSTTPKEKSEFEAMVINADIAHIIQEKLQNSTITRSQLSKLLGIKEKQLDALFSCDLYFTIPQLAQFQNIFNFRFKISAK